MAGDVIGNMAEEKKTRRLGYERENTNAVNNVISNKHGKIYGILHLT